jgi:phosphatidylserine decarboxylase
MAGPDTPIDFYARGTERLEREVVMGERWLRWAYQGRGNQWLHGLLFRWSLPSRLMGWYFDSRFSRSRIQPTVAQLKIDTSEFRDPPDSFASFNDFFTRHLKAGARPVDPDPRILPSPADGRVLVADELPEDETFCVKGSRFTAAELLQRPAPEYAGGTAIVVRLAPPDYHRFHFPCGGQVIERGDVPGYLHSVNPVALALGYRVFTENRRRYTLIESPVFGRLTMVEVGAFGVGSIVWTFAGDQVERMQEKGFFKFGGSTIVLLLEPGRLRLADDLRRHSRAGYETFLKTGQTLGTAVADSG